MPPRKRLKNEAINLIASCEEYLNEEAKLINPFADLNEGPSSNLRKLSSVSVRDSIKETHEEPLSYFSSQTVPRSFHSRQDGTESVRSFVMNPKAKSEEWSQDSDSSEDENDRRNRNGKSGFVNKYVNKVKHYVTK